MSGASLTPAYLEDQGSSSRSQDDGFSHNSQNLSYRLCTYLVLFSFVFQVLWPSTVWAFYPGRAIWKDHEGITVKVKRLSDQGSGQRGIRVQFYDQRDGGFSQSESEGEDGAFKPSVTSSVEPHFSKDLWDTLGEKVLYTFEHEGLAFHVDLEGNVMLVPSALINTPYLDPVRIKTPGFVSLNTSLAVRHLKVKAAQVFASGQQAPALMERVDLWTQRSGPELDQGPGVVLPKDGAWYVRDLVIHGGSFESYGDLRVAAGGVMDLGQQHLSNHHHMRLDSGAKLQGVYTLGNYGTLTADNASLACVVLHNDSGATLSGDRVTLLVQEAFTNNGRLHTSTESNIVVLGGMRNYGTVISQGQQFLSVAGDFYNRGTVWAKQQTLKVQGKTLNEGQLKGKEFSLDLNDLDNQALIEGLGPLAMRVKQGSNQGLIRAKEATQLSILGNFRNERFIESGSSLRVEVQKGATLTNLGQVKSQGLLTVAGQGMVQNQGRVRSPTETHLSVETFHNHHLVSAGTKLTLAVGRLLHNHSTGLLGSEGQTLLTGPGDLINEGVPLPRDEEDDTESVPLGLVSVGPITLESFQGKLDNKGVFRTLQTLRGQTRQFHNAGTVQAVEGYQGLEIEDYLNTGTWLGNGSLVVTQGRNAGLISTEQLKIDVKDALIQEALGATQATHSLEMTGKGTFRNQGFLHTPHFILGVKKVDNQHRLLSEKITVLDSVHALTNRQDALLDSQDLTFSPGSRVQVINKGTWLVSRNLQGTIGSFENGGKVLFEGSAAHALTILETLTTAKSSLWDVSGFRLNVQGIWLHEGSLCLRGPSSLKATLLKNLGKIGRAENTHALLEVKVHELENQGALGFYHLTLSVRDKLMTTSTSVLSATERLLLEYDKAYDHYGTLTAKDLTYQGKNYQAKLTNKGTIMATERSLIQAAFENTASGEADLTGLTLKPVGYDSDTLLVNGKLTLRKVTSLGKSPKQLWVSWGADVKLLDCGYGIVQNNQRVGGGLTFQQVKNFGQLGFGDGTYYVEETLTNHGTQVALAGQNLVCGDVDNKGTLLAPVGLRVAQTHKTFSKLGKIESGQDLTLELGPHIDAAAYLQEHADQWRINGALRVETDRLINTTPLGFAFPVEVTVRNQFENTSVFHAKQIRIKAHSFKQGWRETVYDEVEGTERLVDHLGDLKSEGDLTLETEGHLDNQYGRIKSGGHATLRARQGTILNGQSLPAEYPYRIKNGAFISADKKLTLDAVTILNVFGGLSGYEGLDCIWQDRFLNYSGIIKIQGHGVFRGSLFHNQRSLPATLCRFWGDSDNGGSLSWVQSTGEAAQLLGTGNLYFYVTNLTNEASHITCFGKIRDKEGMERTCDNQGSFVLIDRPHIFDGPVHSFWDALAKIATSGERGSFSSATKIDLKAFADYQLVGARLAGGGVTLQGNRLLLTDNGTTYGSGGTSLPLTTRLSLRPALQELAGGDWVANSQTDNPSFVYTAQTRASSVSSLPPLTLIQKVAQTLTPGAKPEQKRLMMDWVSTVFRLQSTLSRVWGRGYIFPEQSAHSHLVTLLQNAQDEALLRHQTTLTRSQAEQADKPLLTFEEEAVEHDHQTPKETSLVPYLTLPTTFQNLYLLGRGTVMDSDTTLFVKMKEDITTESSTVHAGDDIDFYSGGTRTARTLKDTTVLDSDSITLTRDVARQQDQMISDRGNIRDQSRDDFFSQGVRRQAPRGAIKMGSTHGTTTRLPLELFETCVTRVKKKTLLGGTHRTITHTQATALTDQAYAGQGDLTITSGLNPGQKIEEKATQDRAAGHIRYQGYNLFKQGLIQVNSVHTEAHGVLRSTSAHQEQAVKIATSSIAGGNVILDVINRVEALGWMVSAVDIEDYARESHLGALIQELQQSRSVAGFNRLGYQETTSTLEHETMIPTVLNLDGQYRAYARTDADREGYVLWQGVIATMRGGYVIERRLLEQAVTLRSTHTQTSDGLGLTGPAANTLAALVNGKNPFEGLGNSFLDSTTLGSFQTYTQAEDDQDRAAAALRTINAAFQDIRDLQTILAQKEQALKTVVSRVASVGMSFSTSNTMTRQTTQVPTTVTLAGDAQVLGTEWHHDQGAKLKTTKRVIAPHLRSFSMSPAVQSVEHQTTSATVGVSYNFLSHSIGVNGGFAETTYRQTLHDVAGIEADTLFMRAESLNNTGGLAKARIVDVGIQENASHDTPVDTEITRKTGFEGGVTLTLNASDQKPGLNLKVEDHEKERRRLAAQKSGFVATEQFYYTVGGLSHEISAEIGLKPEGQNQALSFKTQRGETLYHRPMPPLSEDSILYALFASIPSLLINPRPKIVAKLLEAQSDPVIRPFVVQDLLQTLETTPLTDSSDHAPALARLEGAVPAQERLQPLYSKLMQATQAYNQTYRLAPSWLTPEQIVTQEQGNAHPCVEAVRQAFEAYEQERAAVIAWANTPETYQAFLTTFVANPAYRILPRPLSERVYQHPKGLLDALAPLYALEVRLYEPDDQGTLDLVYQSTAASPLRLADAPAQDQTVLLKLFAYQDKAEVRAALAPELMALLQADHLPEGFVGDVLGQRLHQEAKQLAYDLPRAIRSANEWLAWYNGIAPQDWQQLDLETILTIHQRHPTSSLAGMPLLKQRQEELNRALINWAYLPSTYKAYLKSLPEDVLRNLLESLEGPAKDGLSHRLPAFGTSPCQVNLLFVLQEDEKGNLQPHIDRLEPTLESLQVGQRLVEHKPEEAGETTHKSGFKINAPFGEVMALIDNVKSLKAQMMQELQQEGLTVQESEEALHHEDLQALTQEVAKITREVDQALTEQHLKNAALKPKQPSSSSVPVDPALYEDLGRQASVSSPLGGLHIGKEPSLPTQTLTKTQQTLETLSALCQRLETFIDNNPRLAAAGQTLLTSIGYCMEAATYVGAGVAGGAVGGPVGSIVAMSAVYATSQTMTKAVEAGTNQLVSAVSTQGSTQEQIHRFAQTGEWIAKSAATLAVLLGARKAATKWSGRSSNDISENIVVRPQESPYYSTIFQAQLEAVKHFPGKPDRLHFQEANKQLYQNLSSNPGFQKAFEKHFPGITNFLTPSSNGAFPAKPPIQYGLTWHHNSYTPGLMELIPREHHRSAGIVQKNLHPGQKGGMELWGGGRELKKNSEGK